MTGRATAGGARGGPPAAPGRRERLGRWSIWSADQDGLTAAEWMAIVERLRGSGRSLHRSKHADTYRWARSGGDAYVKVYRRYRRWTAFKDWFRPSKAENVRRVSAALAAMGVMVPRVLGVGEERRLLGAGRSWCATAALVGEPVAARLAALARTVDRTTLRAKRAILAAVGREVARLHTKGVIAGDLVPANVWIALAANEATIAFLDHDRTRVAGAPSAWRRARRNLVQLNRVVLIGVSATDRLRVYRAYAAARGWSRAESHRRLAWVVGKTIARRRAERSRAVIARRVDFRTLMRPDGPYAPSSGEGEG